MPWQALFQSRRLPFFFFCTLSPSVARLVQHIIKEASNSSKQWPWTVTIFYYPLPLVSWLCTKPPGGIAAYMPSHDRQINTNLEEHCYHCAGQEGEAEMRSPVHRPTGRPGPVVWVCQKYRFLLVLVYLINVIVILTNFVSIECLYPAFPIVLLFQKYLSKHAVFCEQRTWLETQGINV
ncbi:hypothetical protein ARMGADRAFT_1040923 [Armillaria gallica]|uniref:Uncharacterized protein n=1 Tax=Armillaria gallica TaxID=47427 RepID=A0A2H3CD69_ARMGA|nr:hypothetical protein ARMGADRAFT_1040923 [Armillaria gallica]